MKIFTVLTFCFLSIFGYSQVFDASTLMKAAQLPYPDTLKYWKNDARINLNFNQKYFANWQSGNLNSIGVDININERLSYEKPKFVWVNTLLMQYGLSKQEEQEVRKTNDQFEWNSIIGKRINPQWSYSFLLNAETQIANGYNYDKDLEKKNRTTGFLAPLNLTFGPGIFFKKNSKFFVNFSPIAFKNISINGKIHKWSSTLNRFQSDEEIELFGVEPDKKILWQAGAYANIFYELNIAKNIKAENVLVLYSNYLKDPEKINLDYTLNINFSINSLLSTNLTFRTRYNDNNYKGFQMMQQLGVGLKFKI